MRDRLDRFRPKNFISGTTGCCFVLLATAALIIAGPSFADSGRVYPNADSVEPLAVGQSVPTVIVRSIDNEPIQLAKLTSDRGALLVFYRGGW